MVSGLPVRQLLYDSGSCAAVSAEVLLGDCAATVSEPATIDEAGMQLFSVRCRDKLREALGRSDTDSRGIVFVAAVSQMDCFVDDGLFAKWRVRVGPERWTQANLPRR